MTKRKHANYRETHNRNYVFDQNVTQGAADECWEYKGHRNKDGYGKIGRIAAHRMAYERANGPIPSSMEVCHSCDNPPCCNPAHLFLGTHKDNMVDSARKGRNPGRRSDRCVHGHLFTPENTATYDRKGRPGNPKRECLACRKIKNDRNNAKNRRGRA